MVQSIIAFAGRAQSGKDYRCNKLVETGGFVKLSFADPLRKILFLTLGIPFEEGMKQYEELKRTEIYNGQTLRDMLEHLGTEGIRYYDHDFWAKCMVKELDKVPEEKGVCIGDVRFFNEYLTLKKYATENNIEFSFIFCDYHSATYQEVNNHPSARLANYLSAMGLKDGDIITDKIMTDYFITVE